MKPFVALLRVNFKNLLLTTFSFGRSKRKAASGIGAFLLLTVLMVYLSGTYSFLLAGSLQPFGALDIMLMLMLFMSLLFPFALNIFGAQSLVYSTKDIDLVLSFPVSPFAVMLSRVMALYLELLLMVEMMLLPAGVAWLRYGGSGGPLFLLLLLVAGAFLALVPTLLSLIFGGFISLLVSRLRFKNLFTVLFSFVFVILIAVGSTMLSTLSASIQPGSIAALRSSVRGIFPPIAWVTDALTGPNIPLLLGVIAGCLLPFLAITWLFSRFYKTMLTKLSSHTLKSNYKLRNLKFSGPMQALFTKEARRFFGTPAYVLNIGFSGLLLVAAGVFALFNRSKISFFLAQMLQIPGADIVTTLVPYIILGFLGFFMLVSCSSSVSISLEGKTLWILKSAPLGTRRIFAAKAGFSALLHAVIVTLSVPMLCFSFGLSFATSAVIFLLCLLFGALVGVSGLFVNLLLPRMDAENDTIVIKQSASVIVSMLVSLAFALLVAGLAWLMYKAALPFLLFGALAALLLIGLLALGIALLATKGHKLFTAL